MRAPWLLFAWIASAWMPALQSFSATVRAVLRAREDEHLPPVALVHQMREKLGLAGRVHGDHALGDEVRFGVAARDFDRGRIVQEARRQLADLVGERRREEQVLPLRREDREDAADVADEAHVEHAIGFVEHEDLDAREIDRLLADVVEQASGRGDENVEAARERIDLGLHADAAVDTVGAQRHVLAVSADRQLDLRRELARRRQHQHARGARLGPDRIQCKQLQDRQREPGGLAGAGLCRGEDVAALEDDGNRLDLDGGGLGIAFVRHRTDELGLEAESGKRVQCNLLGMA